MDKERLIQEEQDKLDELIKKMDEAIIRHSNNMSMLQLQKIKAKEQVDAYGMLISSNEGINTERNTILTIKQGMDELYKFRIEVESQDTYGKSRIEDLKIGLHTYMDANKLFILSWLRPVCRHYVLDNAAIDYDGEVKNKYGGIDKTHYTLLLKRQVKMLFDEITDVLHYYPEYDETERIISDEFLNEFA